MAPRRALTTWERSAPARSSGVSDAEAGVLLGLGYRVEQRARVVVEVRFAPLLAGDRRHRAVAPGMPPEALRVPGEASSQDDAAVARRELDNPSVSGHSVSVMSWAWVAVRPASVISVAV
jgi:hypothetical protein